MATLSLALRSVQATGADPKSSPTHMRHSVASVPFGSVGLGRGSSQEVLDGWVDGCVDGWVDRRWPYWALAY